MAKFNTIITTLALLVAAAYMAIVPVYVWFVLGVPLDAPIRQGGFNTVYALALLVACYGCASAFTWMAVERAKA
jgi:hypothetical protein